MENIKIIELIKKTALKKRSKEFLNEKIRHYLDNQVNTAADLYLRKQIIGQTLRTNRKRLDAMGLLRVSEYIEFKGYRLTERQLTSMEKGLGYHINSIIVYNAILIELAEIYNVKLENINL